MPPPIRILFLADSHLGLDLPTNPRVARRRRGHDFLANHRRALAVALEGGIDAVIHGGDVFDRPHVPSSLAYQAYEPLLRVARSGVPVFIVPGNHERSRLPHAGLAAHPQLHVFASPATFTLEVRGRRLALSGFPYERRGVRTRFPELLAATGWASAAAEVRLLCLHHCLEGATVGPGDFTFTTAPDVIRHAEVPAEFAAVLSGHIHRHQVLTRDLRGRALATPVFYPGSVERTSTAEIGERKGFLVLEVQPAGAGGVESWSFRPLPAREMLVRDVVLSELGARSLEAAVRALIEAAPPDAVLRVRVLGQPSAAELRAISASRLRAYAPGSMNVEVRAGDGSAIFRLPARRARAAHGQSGAAPARSANLQLEL